MTASEKPSHHHGNLRSALINAGVQLLSEGGLEALTLRKAASVAGVSHAAPAHHFASLTNLRSAIAAAGFDIFDASMKREIKKVSSSNPSAVIRAACRGYIIFAIDNPALFSLMFGGTELIREEPPLGASSSLAYETLTQICLPYSRDAKSLENMRMLVWSLVHGFTSLMLAQQKNFPSADDAIRQFEEMLPDFSKLQNGE